MDAAVRLLLDQLLVRAPTDGTLEVLVLGACPGPLERALEHPAFDVTRASPAGLEALTGVGRVPVAVCCGALSGGQEVLLARVRDLHAGEVFALEPASGPGREPDSSLRALGFSRLGPATVADGEPCLYGFDVGTYKATPDWLNARYWANPELWDAYRW